MSLLGTSRREPNEITAQLLIALGLVALVFVVIVGRLAQLQLAKGSTFRTISEKIATEPETLPAPRGLIRDRTGVILADNVQTRSLWVTPAEVGDTDEMLAWINAEVLDEPEPDAIRQRWDKAVSYSRYKPSVLVPELSDPELARFETNKWDNHPGLEVKKDIRREYKYPHMFAHTIGYLGEVSDRDLESLNAEIAEPDRRYRRGDYIGKKGVEQADEARLRGQAGRRIVIRNRLGSRLKDRDLEDRVLKELSILENAEKSPEPGKDVYLTIDLGLQQAVAEAFGEKAGAVVVLDVHTGAVRALYNNPTFDPAAFARGLSIAEWSALRDHPDHPLNDKALRGMYPPGSTWKMVVAAAALKYGEVTADEKVFCPGHFRFGNRTYRCWKRGGHGYVDLNKAIQQSCDVYFYKMGLRVGVDRLAIVAREFGFGSPTGVGINDEKGGLVPTREWKRMNRYEEWQEGETLSVAIGQGFDLVTPIQLASAYATLANGGVRMKPHIVEKVIDPNTDQVVMKPEPQAVGELSLTQEAQNLVRGGLYSVVNEPGGTAYWSVRIPELPIAGKTGTSQVIRQDENTSAAALEQFKDHALFAAFAPADDPQYAVAVIVEHGGHGGSAAGPVAKAAFQYLFADEIEKAKEEKKTRRRRPTTVRTPTPAATSTPEATTPTATTPETTTDATTPEAATTAEAATPVTTPESTVAPTVVETPEVELEGTE